MYNPFPPQLRATVEMMSIMGGEGTFHHRDFKVYLSKDDSDSYKEYCTKIYKALEPEYNLLYQLWLPLFFVSPPAQDFPPRYAQFCDYLAKIIREKMVYLFHRRILKDSSMNPQTQAIIDRLVNGLSSLNNLPLPILRGHAHTALHVVDTIQQTTQNSQEFFQNLRNFSPGSFSSEVGRVVRSESTQEFIVGNVPVVGTTVAAILRKITS